MSTSTLLVANPGSRSGDDDLDEYVERFQAQGEVIFERPDKPDNLPELIRRHGPEVDRVVVGGGDGTVNLALDAVIEVDRPLGVLPMGTANDLARSLEIPADLESAFGVIVAGHLRCIDVSYVNDISFVNAIGMGLGPAMTREMDSETKSRWGVLAYLFGVIRAFGKKPRFSATIGLEGREETRRCIQITVANGIHYGGGMTVAEDAKLDDGQLDVLVVRHQSQLSLVGNADRLRSGKTRNADQLTHWRCREVTIETDPVLDVTVDGEFLTRTPVRCKVRPKALNIFAPEQG
jgi:diacylglycerol kinase (ATP)